MMRIPMPADDAADERKKRVSGRVSVVEYPEGAGRLACKGDAGNYMSARAVARADSKEVMPLLYRRIEGGEQRWWSYFSTLLSVGVLLGDSGVRLKTVRPRVLKTPTLSGVSVGPST